MSLDGRVCAPREFFILESEAELRSKCAFETVMLLWSQSFNHFIPSGKTIWNPGPAHAVLCHFPRATQRYICSLQGALRGMSGAKAMKCTGLYKSCLVKMDVPYWQICKGETVLVQLAVSISALWYLSRLNITFGRKHKCRGWCLLHYQRHLYLPYLWDIYWNMRNSEWLKITLIWSLWLDIFVLGHVPSQSAELKGHWQF